MLKIGDKLKYTKTNWLIDIPLGTVMTVTDIKGVNVSAKADYKTNNNVFGTFKCVMSYDEIEKYFEKVSKISNEKTNKNVNKWSGWQVLSAYNASRSLYSVAQYFNSEFNDYIQSYYTKVYEFCPNIQYRTNGKEVQIKVTTSTNHILKVSSRCNKVDTFDLNVGIGICLYRMYVEIMKHKINHCIDKI